MQRMLKWMLVLVVVAVVPSQAEAAVTVGTYSVPVTTPDTLGSPVTLDTDVYVPDRKVPPGGFPFLEVFHGGGSTKDNSYDAEHARAFAEDGYVSLIYSARGHGDSGGQVSVAGPAEIRDLFDVTAWALGIGGRRSRRIPTSTSTASGSPLPGIRRAGCTRTSVRCGLPIRRSTPMGSRSARSSPATRRTSPSTRSCRTRW